VTSEGATARPFAGLGAAVTGASGDIGRAMTLALSGLGAEVCAVSRGEPALQTLAARVEAGAPPLLVHPADLTGDDEIPRLVARLHDRPGRLDVLVHCAGVIATGTHELASVEDLDRQYRANVRAPYLLTKALLPLLRSARGQIVFIGSTAALHVRPGLGQFAATQHAGRALADTLREEVNGDGIRVLSVYPGRTAGRRQEAMFADEGRPYRAGLLLQPSDIAAMVMAALQLPRTAEVTDITMRPLVKSY
jgi:NADP-dependent 3-hydroxy acid dehydrogenase YdfG